MSEQQQPPCIPTRPGWWWCQYTGPLSETISAGPDMVYVDPAVGFDTDPNWQWLAPIPGPAVLAALAEYEAARREIVLLAPVGAHPVAKVGEAPAALERFVKAREQLNITLGLAQFAEIRAERDAERDGGA